MKLIVLTLLSFFSFNLIFADGAPVAGDCTRSLEALTPMKIQRGIPVWDEAHLKEYDNAFKACLGEYIQIRTVNPPGNEQAAVAFLKEAFETLEIPTREWTSEGRPGLVASLEAKAVNGKKPSVLLYHHTDVVPVFPEQWQDPKDTFSGAIHDDFLWGRGSLDMKSTGIMQMLSMAVIQVNDIEITKSIHFIAAADEEVGAIGAISALKEMQPGGALEDLMGAQVLLNEGGYGVSRNKKDVYLIGTEEKGGAWLKVRHADPLKLLQHIDGTFVLLEAHSRRASKSPFKVCHLDQFTTEGAQINVLPSKVKFYLGCPENLLAANGVEANLQSFLMGTLAKSLKANIKIQKDRSGFEVHIELPSAAHGALEGSSALSIAAEGFQSLGILKQNARTLSKPSFYKYLKTPAVTDLIKNIFSVYHLPSWVARGLTSIPGLQQLALKELGKAIFSERLFRTSCSWTGFSLNQGQAEALVDCRLLHTGFYPNPEESQAVQFVEELNKRARDENLKIEISKGWQYARSPIESDQYEIIRSELLKENPKAIVSNFLTPTGSDNAWFRAPVSAGSKMTPIACYGFLPTVLSEGLTGTIHGSNERFPVSQIRPSYKIYTNVVLKLAR